MFDDRNESEEGVGDGAEGVSVLRFGVFVLFLFFGVTGMHGCPLFWHRGHGLSSLPSHAFFAFLQAIHVIVIVCFPAKMFSRQNLNNKARLTRGKKVHFL